MKRLRLLMVSTTLALMLLGVQAVNAACPSSFTAYYDYGIWDCDLTRTVGADCEYSCRLYRFYYT